MTSAVEFVGGPEYSSLCSYDLVSAVQRQSAFYYNVSLPHYRNDNFLRGGIHRYKVRASKHTATLLGYFYSLFDTHNSFSPILQICQKKLKYGRLRLIVVQITCVDCMSVKLCGGIST